MKTELRIRIESVLGFEFTIGRNCSLVRNKKFDTLKFFKMYLTEEQKQKLLEMQEVLRVKETAKSEQVFRKETIFDFSNKGGSVVVIPAKKITLNKFAGTAIWLDKNAKLSF